MLFFCQLTTSPLLNIEDAAAQKLELAVTRSCANAAPHKSTSSCVLGGLRSAYPQLTMIACNFRCDRVAKERHGLRCCRTHLCGACVTKVLKLEYKRRRFYVACPFCRRRTPAATKRVKKLMEENCPDHAVVIESEGGPVAVVHVPSTDGHYGDKSTLRFLPTCLPALLQELLEEIDILSSELTAAQDRCKTLEERERLRSASPWRGTILDRLLAPAGAPDDAALRQVAA